MMLNIKLWQCVDDLNVIQLFHLLPKIIITS